MQRTGTACVVGIGIAATLTFASARARAQQPPPPYSAPPGAAPMQPYGYPTYPSAPSYGTAQSPPPLRMRYVEGRPIPPGYHLESEPLRGLITTGAVLFAVPYGVSVSIAAASQHKGDIYLLVPAFGPFLDLGTRGYDCPSYNGSSACDDSESSTRFMLTLDGLSQASGVALMIVGLAFQQRFLERDDAPFTGAQPSFRWALAPRTFGGRGMGVGVSGEF